MPFSHSIDQYSHTSGSIAVIGAGRMGRFHLGALGRAKVWRLAGVFDRHLGQTPNSEGDLAGWLQGLKPDAAIVAVPPDAHDAVARTCLSAGCHVLLEKPLCSTSVAARHLAAEFDRAGKVLFGGHTERFHPVFLALSCHLEKAGRVLELEAWRSGPAPARKDAGGVVMDLSVHDLDLVRRLAGTRVECVSAMAREPSRFPETISADLGWDESKARLTSRWGEPRRRTLKVVGASGTFEADFLGRSLRFLSGGREEVIDVPWDDPLEVEHAAFARACQGNFDSREDLEPQIQAIELAEAILQSIS